MFRAHDFQIIRFLLYFERPKSRIIKNVVKSDQTRFVNNKTIRVCVIDMFPPSFHNELPKV